MTIIDYSIKVTDENTAIIRSTINSHNLDHTTDKDIISFYKNFSAYSTYDTGLLPLSGTGVLAIRAAGNHVQVTFQHAPQVSYINWGRSEGDRNAQTYLVAQPYRIWIGDLIDGNLFGARMFYSPYPITSPDQELYHLNLPNTNCIGYRGNGVGWQCLYQTEDWTGLSLSEKIIRLSERCSGVETYNDENMKETDGPRFYERHYNELCANVIDKGNDVSFKHLWNPDEWQRYTSINGLDWTLNADLWIPVLVQDLDHQDQHYKDGIPLTLSMALTGDYQAYYTDPYRPKPVNRISRPDLSLDASTIINWIARSHNASTETFIPTNFMQNIVDNRLKTSKAIVFVGGHDLDDDDNDDDEEEDNDNGYSAITCPITGMHCMAEESDMCVDSEDNYYCGPCFNDNMVFCINTHKYLVKTDEKLLYVPSSSGYIDTTQAIVGECPNCGSIHWRDANTTNTINTLYNLDHKISICSYCINDWATSSKYSLAVNSCGGCHDATVINHDDWNSFFPIVKTIGVQAVDYSEPFSDSNTVAINTSEVFCTDCATKYVFCPTGHYVNDLVMHPTSNNYISALITLPKEFSITVVDGDRIIETSLTQLCIECTHEHIVAGTFDLSLEDPFSQAVWKYVFKRYSKAVSSGIAFNSSGCSNKNNLEIPF